MRRTLWMSLFALLVATLPAEAQWTPGPGPLFSVHEEIVKPAMLAQFEAANRDFRQLVLEHKAVMPHFHYLALQQDSLDFLFLAPIPDLNGYTAIGAAFGALAQAAGARFTEVMGRANAALESYSDSIIQLDESLSYRPEKPRVSPESTTFRRLDVYHLQPGKEMEVEALAREFKALFKAKGIPDPYEIYKGILGSEAPLLIVVVPAKDAADHAAADRANREALGEAGRALFARAIALSRRFETRNAELRPELSVPWPTP